MAIVCSIKPDNQKIFKQAVAMELESLKAENELFNLKNFINYIYNFVYNDVTDGNKDVTLQYLSLTPRFIKDIMSSDTELMKYLSKTENFLDDLASAIDQFESDLDNIDKYRAVGKEMFAKLKEASVNSVENTLSSGKAIQIVSDMPKINNFSREVNRPGTPLKTGIGNAISIKEGDENFNIEIKELEGQTNIKKLINTKLSLKKETDETVSLPNVGPVYLMPFTLAQIQELIKEGGIVPTYVVDRIAKAGVGQVLVNEEGYPVFFDQDLKDSIDNTEGMAYVDAFVNVTREQVEGVTPLYQEHKDMIAAVQREQKVTYQEAELLIRQQLKQIQDLKDFTLNNPNEAMFLNIVGGKGGYVHFDYNINNPISSINFGTDNFYPNVSTTGNPFLGEVKGRTYFYLNTLPGQPLEVERPRLSEEFASNLANILVNDVKITTKTGQVKPIGNALRFQIANTYLYLSNSNFNINYDIKTDTYSISLFGKDLNLTDKEAAYKRLMEFFTTLSPKREIPEGAAKAMIEKGSPLILQEDPDFKSKYSLNAVFKSANNKFYIVEYTKLHFSNDAISEGYIDFEIEKTPEGMFLKARNRNAAEYREFIRKNGIVHYQLNAEGKIVSLNPYLIYEMSKEVLDKLYPSIEPQVEAAPKDVTTDSNLSDYDFLSDWGAMDKNLRQKMMNAGVTPEKLEGIVEWYESTDLYKVGKIPLRVLFNVVNKARPNSVATFFQNGITLWKGSDYSDIYHEAWHGFTQFFLTKEEKDALYDSLRKKKGTFTDYLGHTQYFATAEDKQLEEYLAEDFRDYMLNGQKTKKSEPARNTIFRKIFNALKALFEKLGLVDVMVDDRQNPLIKKYYDALRVGNLSQYTFNQENVQFREGLDKTLEATNKDEQIKALSRESTKLIKDSVDALLSEYRTNMNKPLTPPQMAEFNRLSAIPINDLTDAEKNTLGIFQKKVFGKFTVIDMLKPKMLSSAYGYVKNRFNQDYQKFAQQLNTLIEAKKIENPTMSDDEINALPDVQEIAYKVDTLGYAIRNFGDTTNIAANEKYKGVIGYHFAKSTYISQQIRENLLLELEEEENKENMKLFEKGGNDMSFIALADKEVLYMVAGLYQLDKQGAVETNKLGYAKLVNGKSVMNRLAKILNGIQSPEQMAKRMQLEIDRGNPVLKQLLDQLGSPTEYEKVNVYEMWDKFWNTFNLTRISPIMENYNTIVKEETIEDEFGGEITIRDVEGYTLYTGTSPNLDVERIKRQWNINFQQNFESEYLRQDSQGRFLGTDGLNRLMTNYKNIVGRELQFLSELGIVIPEEAMADSTIAARVIKHTGFVHKKLEEANRKSIYDKDKFTFKPLRNIKDLELPFSDKYAAQNLNSDIKALAEIADMFTESSSEFMFTNAAGDSKYELSKNSTITQIINAVNSVDNFNDLVSRPEFAHFGINVNSFITSSIRFNTIFDFSKPYGPKRKYDEQGKLTDSPTGKYAKLSIRDLSGILTMTNGAVDGKGKVSASLSEFEKLIHDIHSAVNGIVEHPRHGDKSTYSAVGTDTYLVGTQGRKKLLTVANLVIDNDYSTKEYQALLALENKFAQLGDRMPDSEYADMVSRRQKIQNRELNFIFENVFVPYIAAEHSRINKFKGLQEMYDNKPMVVDYYMDFDYLKRGQEFHIFDKVLSSRTKSKLLDVKGSLKDFLKQDENSNLKEAIFNDLRHYFEDQTNLVQDRLPMMNTSQGMRPGFLAPNIVGDIRASLIRSKRPAKQESIERAILRSYTINTFINIYEDMTMFYGDIAEYLMQEKDEGHKRNALFGSFGDVPRNDNTAKNYINNIGRKYADSLGFGANYPAYDGSLRTAVLGDVTAFSQYILTNYLPAVVEDEKKRMLKNPEAKKLSDGQLTAIATEQARKILKEYGINPKTGELTKKMKVADAQGWVAFDSYRMILKLFRKWTPQQEDMYQKIVNKKDISSAEILKTFPVVKLQYSGPIANQFMAMNGAHKYSLLPLIPTMVKGKGLEKLHTRMMEQGLDYAVMKSGSKISTVTKNGVPDKFYSDEKTAEVDMSPVAVNKVFVPFLKYQTHIEPEYKGEISFFSQMRKLIENNLFEGGVPVDFMAEETDLNKKIEEWDKLDHKQKEKKSEQYRRVFKYEQHLSDLVKAKKEQLLREIDWKYDETGKLTGKLSKLLDFVTKQMERQNLSEQEIELIREMKSGKQHDLSLLMNAQKIEKLLNSIVIRRLVKPKIKGEGLIQASNVGFENIEAMPGARKFEMASEEELEKYGTWDLPAAKLLKRKDGSYYVKGAKVKISIQGDYKKLLRLKEVQDLAAAQNITPLKALNQLIRDEEWLNKGENRKMVRLVGARIPTQGHNSMEYVEVYEFLPEESGNIIVPPYEIVAKSGGDFDVDKLFMMMPHIKEKNGKAELFKRYSSREIDNMYGIYLDKKLWQFDSTDALRQKIADIFGVPFEDWKIEVADEQMYEELIRQGKAMTKEEFEDTVSGTKAIENELLDDIAGILLLPENFVSMITPNDVSIAKGLADTLAKVNRKYNMYHNPWGEDLGYISSTNFFEFGHNLFKHVSNSVGKQTLGLGAVDNTFNSIFNRIGMYLNPDFVVRTRKDVYTRRVSILLNHNSYVKDGRKVISLSHLMDSKNQYKISEIISQMINGWVDVAKDAWIFDIQGNKIVSPTLLFMIQAGVPFEEAIYFVSQPVIVEYINEIIDHQGIFSEPMDKRPDNIFFAQNAARRKMISKYQSIFEKYMTKKEADRFNPSKMLSNKTIYNLTTRLTENNTEAFTLPFLEQNISKRGNYTGADMAILTHFFELQDHAKSLRDIKLNLNFDTTPDKSLFAAMKKQRAVEKLRQDGRIPIQMIDKIINNTPIGPFYVQDFQQEIWQDLFGLRNHDNLNKELVKLLTQSEKSLTSRFEDEEEAVITYKNDLNSYIFENAIKSFNPDKLSTYKGLDVEMEVKEAPGLSFPAIVLERDGKKVLYVNRKLIEREWLTKSFDKDSYTLKGNSKVNAQAFFHRGFREYMHFVIERAVVQDMYTYDEVKNRLDFKHLVAENKLDTPKQVQEADAEYESRIQLMSYRDWVRDTALTNIFNVWQMFYSNNSFPETFAKIRSQYPDLYKDFSVMNFLNVAPRRKTIPYALTIADPKADAESMDIYRDDILSLSNDTVKKVDNEQDNRMITEFFKKFSIYAMFQSGLTERGQYAIGRLANGRQILSILEPAAAAFQKKLDVSPDILKSYNAQFLSANANRGVRSRLKDYTYDARFISPDKFISQSVYNDKVNLHDSFKATAMEENQLYVFDSDVNNTPSALPGLAYTKLTSGNLLPFGGKLNQGTASNSYFYDIVNADGSITMNPELKQQIDDFISALEKFDGKINMPKQGLGQYMVGLQEAEYRKKEDPKYGVYDRSKMSAPASFEYLSRLLFEKFQYINPGSLDISTPEVVKDYLEKLPIVNVPYDTTSGPVVIEANEAGDNVIKVDMDKITEDFESKAWTKPEFGKPLPEDEFVSPEDYGFFLIYQQRAANYNPYMEGMDKNVWMDGINKEALAASGKYLGAAMAQSLIKPAGTINDIHNQKGSFNIKPQFNKELIDKKILNGWEAIKTGYKTQFSRDIKAVNYNVGDYVFFNTTYFTNLRPLKMVVQVTELSDKTVAELLKENPQYAKEWSKNEGLTEQMLKENPGILRKYPVKFELVGIMDADGKWLETSDKYRNESIAGIEGLQVARKLTVPSQKFGIRAAVTEMIHPETTDEMVMDKLKFCGIFTS